MENFPDLIMDLRNDRPVFRTRAYAAASLLAIVVVAALAMTSIRRAGPKRGAVAAVGRSLPRMIVFERGGRAVDLSSVSRGARHIIAFYSPSCEICQRELPNVRPLPHGLRLILVSITEEASDPFARWPEVEQTLVDRDHVLQRNVPMSGVPLLLLVDEKGVLRDAIVGDRGARTTREKLERFARGAAGS